MNFILGIGVLLLVGFALYHSVKEYRNHEDIGFMVEGGLVILFGGGVLLGLLALAMWLLTGGHG